MLLLYCANILGSHFRLARSLDEAEMITSSASFPGNEAENEAGLRSPRNRNGLLVDYRE